jgi:hypothetical protein
MGSLAACIGVALHPSFARESTTRRRLPVTVITPKIREAMERKTDAELQGVVADAENWTPPAVEAAREELHRRGVRKKPSWVEWLERWPGRAAFAEEDDAPQAAGN